MDGVVAAPLAKFFRPAQHEPLSVLPWLALIRVTYRTPGITLQGRPLFWGHKEYPDDRGTKH